MKEVVESEREREGRADGYRGVRRATRGKKGAAWSAQHHAARMTQRTLTPSTGENSI